MYAAGGLGEAAAASLPRAAGGGGGSRTRHVAPVLRPFGTAADWRSPSPGGGGSFLTAPQPAALRIPSEVVLSLPVRTPSTSTPYQAAKDHLDACEGQAAGLGDAALFNAYAQLAQAICQVGSNTPLK